MSNYAEVITVSNTEVIVKLITCPVLFQRPEEEGGRKAGTCSFYFVVTITTAKRTPCFRPRDITYCSEVKTDPLNGKIGDNGWLEIRKQALAI